MAFSRLKACITSRSKRSPEHKPVFSEVQKVNIHESRKVAIALLNGLLSLLDLLKKESNVIFISYKITGLSKA